MNHREKFSATEEVSIATMSPEQKGLYRDALLGHLGTLLALRISELRVEQLEYLSTHDELTGALNRRGLSQHLETADTPKAVLFIDATNFKAINDAYNHARGDQVIQENYKILQDSTRPTDIIARIGGDEFLIVLNGEPDIESHEFKSDRRHEIPSNKELVNLSRRRISRRMKTYLKHNTDLQAVNYNLAVGGIVWDENMSLMDLITTAEKAMKVHKTKQHEEAGKYR